MGQEQLCGRMQRKGRDCPFAEGLGSAFSHQAERPRWKSTQALRRAQEMAKGAGGAGSWQASFATLPASSFPEIMLWLGYQCTWTRRRVLGRPGI